RDFRVTGVQTCALPIYKVGDIGDALPSINDLSYQLQIARDTVEKGYRKLRMEEIIKSSPGKGYFVARQHAFRLRTAVFLNKLSRSEERRVGTWSRCGLR